RLNPRPQPPRRLHHFIRDPAEEQSISLGELLGPVTMQLFIRGTCAMIAAPVQSDVDGIPKGSHYLRVPIAIAQPNENQFPGCSSFAASSSYSFVKSKVALGNRRRNSS